jgi:putative flippase GtrA
VNYSHTVPAFGSAGPQASASRGGSLRLRIREMAAFGLVGGVCFVLDLGLFQMLYGSIGLGAVSARFVSTVISMTVGYFAHRCWSFGHRTGTGVRRGYLLFAVINGVTLLLGLGIVATVRYLLHQDNTFVLQVANIISVAIAAVLRFLSYRRWVFVRGDLPTTQVMPLPAAAPSAC